MSTLPMPIESYYPWTGKEEFVEALQKLESKLEPLQYKGCSICRVCDESNGSAEFQHEGWAWPSGYLHYVEDHNIRPSLAFQEMVLDRHLA